jgi:hypothetical protein
MAISIDEVTAEVSPDVSTSVQSLQLHRNGNQVSSEAEIRRFSELQSYSAVRAARLRAE